MKSLARSSGTLGISLVLPLLAAALPAQEAAYTPFGAGCAGSVGVPVILGAEPGKLPRIGNTFTVRLGNLPPGNGSGFVVFGFSKTDWAGIPLPADLTPVGLWGCTLYTSVDFAFPVMTSGGAAEFPVLIPNAPSLLALEFFNQALFLDPGVNPFLGGAVVTNAAAGIIGPPGFGLTVEILGGTMGTSPQPNVRVLRHDVVTGAVLDDQLTNANGVADFGKISTPRSTITVVEPPASPGDDGFLFTLTNFQVGALTLDGGPEPAQQTNFNITMTGVPAGANVASVHLSTPGGDHTLAASTVTPPTANVFGVDVRHLQPNGKFSVVTQVGTQGTGITVCGLLLDQDPATIIPGSNISIDTSAAPSSVPYTANVPVVLSTVIRRNGLLFEEFLTSRPAMMAGSHTFCDIPGADRYCFFFEADVTPTQTGVGRGLVFDAPPASMNATMPDVNITGLTRNAVTRTLSWTPSGSDLGEMDAGFVFYEWVPKGTSSFMEWFSLVAEGTTALTLPTLPPDLAFLEPPDTGVTFGAELAGSDLVTGFDEFVSQLSAVGGNFETLFLTSNVTAFASRSGRN